MKNVNFIAIFRLKKKEINIRFCIRWLNIYETDTKRIPSLSIWKNRIFLEHSFFFCARIYTLVYPSCEMSEKKIGISIFK